MAAEAGENSGDGAENDCSQRRAGMAPAWLKYDASRRMDFRNIGVKSAACTRSQRKAAAESQLGGNG